MRPRRFFRTDRAPLQSDVRRRYDFLFDLIQNAGLRISEALAGKVRDVCLANGIAKSVGVIGKGNKERLVPFPEAFGQVFGYWSANMRRGDFVFVKAPGNKLPGAPGLSCVLEPADREGQN